MILPFLLEWAVRSSILILGGASLVALLRLKDPAVRLAAWTALLAGSLSIPLLSGALPRIPVTLRGVEPLRIEAPAPPSISDFAPAQIAAEPTRTRPFDWRLAATIAYVSVACVFLLRVSLGLLLGLRLLRRSRATGQTAGGIAIRESDRVAAPVTLGILRSAIVLPAGWREWDRPKLDAVVAHEQSHAERRDGAVQLAAALHRAVLWISPLSWFLERRLVRAAEEASDDAAIVATRDRAFYAEVLLDFMRVPRPSAGVPMARYGSPETRIGRILDGAVLSHGVGRARLAVILALASPLAWLAAAAQPQTPQQQSSQSKAAPSEPFHGTVITSSPPNANYIAGLGTVMPSSTVTVRSRVDGQLMTVDFKEGETVQAGQLLATIDARPYQFPVEQAQFQITQDQQALRDAQASPTGQPKVAQIEGQLKADQAKLEAARIQLSYTRIVAPIGGVTGLRQVDPGNLVHTTDPNGIVVITQSQPIAVVFSISEDDLSRVMERFRAGASQVVEAWSRDASKKLATGRLTAVDNQIDPAAGTAKLKAVFDNKDGALFVGEFVNVRLHL